MARHIEHPAARHSNPASIKILSRPSSGYALDQSAAGDDNRSHAVSHLATFINPATSRRSSSRPLVQLPINTVSIAMSLIGV